MYKSLIKPFLNDVKKFLLDTLFPITCLACGIEGVFICPDCKIKLKTLEHQLCIVCQRQAPFGITHPRCQTPQGTDALISFYDYKDERVAKIIIGGKYSFIPEIYKELGKMMANKIKKDHPYLLTADSCQLTPVPLHHTRKRWRGFNQAEILCQAMSKELNIPTADVLIRTKLTKTQKDLKREQRLKNISDAFKLKPGTDIKNKALILIDDVTTTGATLKEATKILKRNGAFSVICLTVARD
jgi:competence protein ComFC